MPGSETWQPELQVGLRLSPVLPSPTGVTEPSLCLHTRQVGLPDRSTELGQVTTFIVSGRKPFVTFSSKPAPSNTSLRAGWTKSAQCPAGACGRARSPCGPPSQRSPLLLTAAHHED